MPAFPHSFSENFESQATQTWQRVANFTSSEVVAFQVRPYSDVRSGTLQFDLWIPTIHSGSSVPVDTDPNTVSPSEYAILTSDMSVTFVLESGGIGPLWARFQNTIVQASVSFVKAVPIVLGRGAARFEDPVLPYNGNRQLEGVMYG
jgi:hypothetical protein